MSLPPSSFRTARRNIIFLGSAHSGTGATRQMRLTSLALVPLTITFVIMMFQLLPKDYNSARTYLGHPLPAILMLLFVGLSAWHMQLGMKMVIEDYLHNEKYKDAALVANLFFCVLLGVTAIYAILRI